VLKTVLLLQAISQNAGDSVELFIPNERNINNAFEGSDLDGSRAGRCAEKLVRDKVLFKKQLGGGKFQYCAYVNEVSGATLSRLRPDEKKQRPAVMRCLSDDNITDAITSGCAKTRYDFDMYVNRLDSTVRLLAISKRII
jgi:hypothetical protein